MEEEDKGRDLSEDIHQAPFQGCVGVKTRKTGSCCVQGGNFERKIELTMQAFVHLGQEEKRLEQHEKMVLMETQDVEMYFWSLLIL